MVKSEEIFFGFLGFFIKNNRESNKNRWVERKDIKREKALWKLKYNLIKKNSFE
ncbi:hypothetical protein HMPREF1977_0421 [Capnocytophaga ochracea F0287]|uniref:Uncharacterized protein n=1 Tax=Capnocytophaga ochracea F0287 TaxID=873517 RepID=E4MPW1_CAPOC|nr:hypothetical protein HMPREF1977_0421 [Capnocytophaga ochracea F0287]